MRTANPKRQKPANTGRKAQVTIYIALSLIVLALLATILYYKQMGVREELEASVRRIVVPPEAETMQDFMTSCLEKTANEGIKQIASHGGYITVPARINKARPTDGEAVTLSPSSDQAIPYWNFLASDDQCTGTCRFAGLQPPLKKPEEDSIENQLDKYIAANIGSCIDGFKRFKEEGYTVTPSGALTISSTITDLTAAVYAQYPVRFERAGQTTQTNEMFIAIPVKLGLAYKLADEITKAQREHRFLEKHLKQLIDMQSGLGPGQLPPIYEVEFRVGTGTTWTKSEVKKRLQDLLSTYTQFLQVFGTANHKKIFPPRTAGTDPQMFDTIYNRNMLVITSQDHGYPELEARFSYLPWWEPYFDLNCQGELCRPEALINTLGITYGIQRYLFSYDMSFPAMVEIRDPEAFLGEGMSFTFMLEGNLRNNNPLTGDFQPIRMDSGIGDTFFCDPGQMSARTAAVSVTDGKTRKPVPDADLMYTCGPDNHENSSSCSIGRTGKDGRLSSRLPVCIGGMLSILKDGYAPAYAPFDSDEDGIGQVSAILEPKRIIDIDVQRIRLQKTSRGWRLDDTPVGLDPYEEASVAMRRQGGPYDEEFFAVAQQIGDVIEDSKSGLHTGIEIVPGNYTVEVSTILAPGTPIVIPPDRRCYEDKCVDAPKDPITFDRTKPLPIGGASITYEVKKTDLDQHRTLVLYAIDVSLDTIPESERKIEDLEMIGDIGSLSQAYRKQIEPTWEE